MPPVTSSVDVPPQADMMGANGLLTTVLGSPIQAVLYLCLVVLVAGLVTHLTGPGNRR